MYATALYRNIIGGFTIFSPLSQAFILLPLVGGDWQEGYVSNQIPRTSSRPFGHIAPLLPSRASAGGCTLCVFTCPFLYQTQLVRTLLVIHVCQCLRHQINDSCFFLFLPLCKVWAIIRKTQYACIPVYSTHTQTHT